jgi:hypothetical protein
MAAARVEATVSSSRHLRESLMRSAMVTTGGGDGDVGGELENGAAFLEEEEEEKGEVDFEVKREAEEEDPGGNAADTAGADDAAAVVEANGRGADKAAPSAGVFETMNLNSKSFRCEKKPAFNDAIVSSSEI